MLEIKVQRCQRGAMVKMHVLPVAVLVGGLYQAGEVVIPLCFVCTCPCPGLAAWEWERESGTHQVDK